MATQQDFTQFLKALGAFESGINPAQSYSGNELDWLMVFDPNKGGVDRSSVDLNNADDLSSLQYHVHNTLGFLGKYQFGEPLLIDLGYYTPAASGFYGSTATNEWLGTWTGKNGVNSKEDFMSSVQELAIREAFAMNMDVINARLEQADKSLDDYLGQTFTYTRAGVEHVAEVSLSGILASAHLQGPGGVANLLLNNSASSDEYGTNILFYMDSFGGFSSPFGSAVDDNLTGSDYNETFSGGEGVNTLTTGGGYDKVEIVKNSNGQDIIKDFDVAKDAISLAKLEGVTYDDLSIANNGDGNAQVNLDNNQKIIFEGVDASSLSAQNFVQGMVTLGWNYNSGDTILEHFNLQHDLLDLNYAFELDNLSLYQEGDSTVLDVVNNNQRYILEGVNLAELQPYHFIKAPIGFAALFDGAATVPSDDISGDETAGAPDNSSPTAGSEADVSSDPASNSSGDGMYSFSWNWGANEVITDFDPAVDVVNLQSLWTNYSSIDLVENALGDAVIDMSLLNNQTITLQGVSLSQLSANNINGVAGDYPSEAASTDVPPAEPVEPTEPAEPAEPAKPDVDLGAGQVHSYNWNWGGQSVIDNFDTAQDTIDLSAFWTDYGSFTLADNADGNAVIDLTVMNNQSITLIGVSVNDLSADNITGVQGDIAQALSDNASVIDVGTDSVIDDSSSILSPGQDIFSFTWAWGSNDVVSNFDVSEDVIDLQSFWTTSEEVAIYNNDAGDAVIDLTDMNNQTITIEGVSADQITDNNIVF